MHIAGQDTHQWARTPERLDEGWYSQSRVFIPLLRFRNRWRRTIHLPTESVRRHSDRRAIESNRGRIDDKLVPTTSRSAPGSGSLPRHGHYTSNGRGQRPYRSSVLRRYPSTVQSIRNHLPGWNTARFDDTVSRFGFWRNFLDPYEHTYKNGCGTWDLIDLARAARALRPAGLNWPLRDDGAPSFRLEDLTSANDIEHGDAHDAMADVRATIAIASRLLEHQPDLWNWARSLIDTQKAEGILKGDAPFVHTSSRIPAQMGCTSPFRMLAPHPVNKRSFICWDLRHDPSELLDAGPDEIMRRTFSSSEDLGEQSRFPLKEIKSNKAPFLAPTSVLQSGDHDLLQLEEDRWRAHDAILTRDSSTLRTVRARIQEAWRPIEHEPADAAESLYEGFPSHQDIRLRNKVPGSDHTKLAGIGERFEDPRLQSLMLQYRAREAADTLDATERHADIQRARQRLLMPPGKSSLGWPAWLKHVRSLLADEDRSNDEITILQSVEAWGIELAYSIGLPVPANHNTD